LKKGLLIPIWRSPTCSCDVTAIPVDDIVVDCFLLSIVICDVRVVD